jgi:hypothetical protein
MMAALETNVVTPLRPETKVKDPTGPIRSRRARQKKTASSKARGPKLGRVENINEINISDTVPVTPATTGIDAAGASLRERLALVSAAAIGGVAIAATALSLSDLAESIGEVAHVVTWKAYAMAIALDANFIATEAFSLFASAAVSEATRRATAATKVVTLAMSAVANAYAMAHTVDNPIMQAACIAAGCAIPGLVALATFTLGKAVRA